MIRIHLYWSNICILHRQELVFLDQIKNSLKTQGIELTVTCFGLGYGTHISDYLREPGSALPDMIVSTDLEIFEDSRLFSRLESGLHPLALDAALKQTEHVPLLKRGSCLLPYLAIPLVLYARAGTFPGTGAPSLGQLAREGFPLAFGGIRNSAAKTVVKTVWEAQGEETARRLLAGSTVTDMPIQAFKRVQTGESPAALVPSVYALRADGRSTLALCPSDGAVAVPSYICARDTIPQEAAMAVVNALRAPEISRFYVENGCMISCAPDSPPEPWMASAGGVLRLPSMQFLGELSPEKFYEVYGVLSERAG